MRIQEVLESAPGLAQIGMVFVKWAQGSTNSTVSEHTSTPLTGRFRTVSPTITHVRSLPTKYKFGKPGHHESPVKGTAGAKPVRKHIAFTFLGDFLTGATPQASRLMSRPCSLRAQQTSPRNFNLTTDIPKGKFRKILLLWNQNEELVLIHHLAIINFRTGTAKGNKVRSTAK